MFLKLKNGIFYFFSYLLAFTLDKLYNIGRQIRNTQYE